MVFGVLFFGVFFYKLGVSIPFHVEREGVAGDSAELCPTQGISTKRAAATSYAELQPAALLLRGTALQLFRVKMLLGFQFRKAQ